MMIVNVEPSIWRKPQLHATASIKNRMWSILGSNLDYNIEKLADDGYYLDI